LPDKPGEYLAAKSFPVVVAVEEGDKIADVEVGDVGAVGTYVEIAIPYGKYNKALEISKSIIDSYHLMRSLFSVSLAYAKSSHFLKKFLKTS
jgi:hypothetical protein